MRSFPDAAVGKTDHGCASSFHRQSFRESSSEHGGTDGTSSDTVQPVVFSPVGLEIYLSPVMDLFNREIVAHAISRSSSFAQTRAMLEQLFARLPKDATPIMHSDQGWQYQMREYQSMLKEHNITQSMSRKGNCLDNSVMENFFGRLKTEMFIGETFSSVEDFQQKLEEYICYFNNERISLKLKGMSPVQFRTHSMEFNQSKFLGSHHAEGLCSFF